MVSLSLSMAAKYIRYRASKKGGLCKWFKWSFCSFGCCDLPLMSSFYRETHLLPQNHPLEDPCEGSQWSLVKQMQGTALIPGCSVPCVCQAVRKGACVGESPGIPKSQAIPCTHTLQKTVTWCVHLNCPGAKQNSCVFQVGSWITVMGVFRGGIN